VLGADMKGQAALEFIREQPPGPILSDHSRQFDLILQTLAKDTR